MELNGEKVTMDWFVFSNMTTENTLLKRDIHEATNKIYCLEADIKDKEKLIDSLFETIKSLGG